MIGLNKKKLRPQFFGGPVLETWLHMLITGPDYKQDYKSQTLRVPCPEYKPPNNIRLI
jgi:hypothetical protein